MPVAISWLVTGARGQLGHDLLEALRARPDDEVTGLGRPQLDLLDESGTRTAVRQWLAGVRGDQAVLVNAAAYTAVDAAETDEATARVVNGDAPGWLAQEMAGRGRLLHVSTDYVFDGTATRPYRPDDEPSPRSAYGRTKLAGERAVAAAAGDALVVRTSWVYATRGHNFVRTMLRLAGESAMPVRVVDDQTGSPTWSRELAAGLVRAAATGVHGIVHASGTGATTWWGLARRVFEAAGADPERVVPGTTGEVPRPAPRPAYSVLDPVAWLAAGLPALPRWEDSVRAAVRELLAEGAR
jgi:dTDP-4-dehydrorhamnose reductase